MVLQPSLMVEMVLKWLSNGDSIAQESTKLMRNECISRSKFLLGQTVWCNYRYFIFKKFRKSAYYPRIIGESVVFGHWDHRSFVPRCSS